MKKLENIAYRTEDKAQMLDLYLPEEAPKSVFVYFHGGGIEKGDKCGAAVFAPYLLSKGIAVASANYRMYPDHTYPSFIYDAAAAVAWCVDYMKKEFGCENVYVGGSSAGGYLSMMLCFDPKYYAAVGIDNSCISGYFHDAGQPTAHFNVLKYSGVDPRRVIVNEMAPLYHIGTAPSYPPMRFIVSDNDMRNRYEQTVLMLSTMKHFGYQNCDMEVRNGKHCHYVNLKDEAGMSVFGQMFYDFYNKVMG